jgi:phosphatidylglycerol:prolipoprotein diacylglycerol transferase
MHPILFKIGSFHLYTYGALLATAFLVAISLAMRTAEREGVKSDFIADLGIIIILSSIVGARLFYIVFYDLENTIENPRQLLKLQQTGLVFYGGLIFAVGAAMAYTRVKKVSIPVVMDITAPSIALGQAVGRIGCFMSGCCYGTFSSLPWAVTFPHLEHPRHPTQIYESLVTFAIFLTLLWYTKRKTAAGQVAWLYLTLYATSRFVLEFARGDNLPFLFNFTISQVVSLLALSVVLPLGYFIWHSKRSENRSSGDGG